MLPQTHRPLPLVWPLLVVALLASGCITSGVDVEGPESSPIHLPNVEAPRLPAPLITQESDDLTITLEIPEGREIGETICTAQIARPIEHGASISTLEPQPTAVVLRQVADGLTISTPLTTLAALTWFPEFDVNCHVRVDGKLWMAHPTTYTWPAPPRIGDRDAAFGVGPFFDDAWTFEGRSCNVAAEEMHAHQDTGGKVVPAEDTQYVCSPPNEVREGAIWQDEGHLYLKVRLGDEPHDAATMTWSYHGSGGGAIRLVNGIRYSVEKEEARKDDVRIDAERDGPEIMLTVPLQLLEDREHESYIKFSIAVWSGHGNMTYFGGTTPPPYWLV